MLTYKDLLLIGPEAVCVLNADLEIRQYNQLASLLLGYRNIKLIGQHVSSILYDDALISHLLASDSEPGWSQGECTLKTSSDLPLVVKFRAAMVADYDQVPTSDEQVSETQSTSDTVPAIVKRGYVLVFREMEETQRLDHERRLKSLRFLLDAVSKRDMEPKDILLEFARIFDRHAEVTLLTPRPMEEKRDLPLSRTVTEVAFKAMSERMTVIHRDKDLWCFLPICSPGRVYGVACIKFAVPRHYGEEDKEIFGLAGAMLGLYMETSTSTGGRSSSQSLLQTVLNSIDCSVIVVDRKGLITLCNSAVQDTYGYNIPDMMGRSFGEIAFPADSSIQYDFLLAQVMRGDPILSQEMTHVRSDHSMLEVSLSAYPYTLDNGSIIGVIFVISDLREKKRLWSKMVQWEKLAALGELLSSVANELNNPLTPLTGYCELLLHRTSDQGIDNMVSTIHRAAERCANIVRNVLDLARSDETRTEHLHVNDIIMTTLNLKRHHLQERNIDVRTNLGNNTPGVVAEPWDIERLFLRIINYAEQRMVEYDNGGQLTVESAFEDGNIIVRFIDTGTCVLTDDMAEILDPFSTAGGEDEGVGLGLSISCQILRDIGGDLYVDSHIGKGNIFTVKMPVASEEPSHVSVLEGETASRTTETGKRIMVVDDEPAIVDMLAQTIEQMGHISDVAKDGNEAMKKLDSEHYDLIITDLRMPSGFTGDKLHEFIKRKDHELSQRMIFITGDVANPETRKFLETTGNPYLEKPFTLEKLRTAIQGSLGKRKTIGGIQ